MGQIIMTAQEPWPSEENFIGDIRVILSGGTCRIDWGDGTDILYEADGQELHVQHTYLKKNPEAEETYVIKIYSDEENITGIYAECGDLNVIDIDISHCRSLRYFASLSASHFDLRTNPELTKVDIDGDFYGNADFSNSQNLKELSISLTYAIGIDLSNCSRLEKFKCTAVLEPVKITLPKYFPLKEFTFDDTIWWCFTKRQFKKIVSVIEHNGGKMVNALMLREYPHSEFFLQPGQAQNHPAQSCHYMREQIKMAVSPFRKRYIACIAVLLDDGPCIPAHARLLREEVARRVFGGPQSARTSCVEVIIREGRKNQVKRMLSAIGHPVLRLHRPQFGPLELGNLAEGSWRMLSESEVQALKATPATRPTGTAAPAHSKKGSHA